MNKSFDIVFSNVFAGNYGNYVSVETPSIEMMWKHICLCQANLSSSLKIT